VAVVDALEHLLEAMCCLGLSEELLLNDLVEQLSSLAQLGDQVKVLFVLEVLVKLQDMRVVELLEDGDLCSELVDVLDLLSGDGFAGSVLLAHSVTALGHHSERTCSQGFL